MSTSERGFSRTKLTDKATVSVAFFGFHLPVNEPKRMDVTGDIP